MQLILALLLWLIPAVALADDTLEGVNVWGNLNVVQGHAVFGWNALGVPSFWWDANTHRLQINPSLSAPISPVIWDGATALRLGATLGVPCLAVPCPEAAQSVLGVQFYVPPGMTNLQQRSGVWIRGRTGSGDVVGIQSAMELDTAATAAVLAEAWTFHARPIVPLGKDGTAIGMEIEVANRCGLPGCDQPNIYGTNAAGVGNPKLGLVINSSGGLPGTAAIFINGPYHHGLVFAAGQMAQRSPEDSIILIGSSFGGAPTPPIFKLDAAGNIRTEGRLTLTEYANRGAVCFGDGGTLVPCH